MRKLLIIVSMFMTFLIGYGKPLQINVEKGAKIPNFELKDFNRVSTKSRKIFNNGKPTLLVFAAEWCPHCRTELPEVQKFYDANKDKVNVVVVFTNSQTNLGKTQTYVKDNGYTFPAYFDENGAITRGFAVDGFPYNLKINNGKVEEKLELPVDFDSLTASFAK